MAIDDMAYDAWVLLANGTYWDSTDPENVAKWEEARTRWRDKFHAKIDESNNLYRLVSELEESIQEHWRRS